MIQQKVERILLFGVVPEHVCFSVLCFFSRGVSLRCHVSVFSCFNAAFVALTHVSWWCWKCATLNVFLRVMFRVVKTLLCVFFNPKA